MSIFEEYGAFNNLDYSPLSHNAELFAGVLHAQVLHTVNLAPQDAESDVLQAVQMRCLEQKELVLDPERKRNKNKI